LKFLHTRFFGLINMKRINHTFYKTLIEYINMLKTLTGPPYFFSFRYKPLFFLVPKILEYIYLSNQTKNISLLGLYSVKFELITISFT